MASNGLFRTAIVCPYCKTLNEIMASDVHESEPVTCSQCHEVIGLWRDIRKTDRSRSEELGQPG